MKKFLLLAAIILSLGAVSPDPRAEAIARLVSVHERLVIAADVSHALAATFPSSADHWNGRAHGFLDAAHLIATELQRLGHKQPTQSSPASPHPR